jgi:hypothetical protein
VPDVTSSRSNAGPHTRPRPRQVSGLLLTSVSHEKRQSGVDGRAGLTHYRRRGSKSTWTAFSKAMVHRCTPDEKGAFGNTLFVGVGFAPLFLSPLGLHRLRNVNLIRFRRNSLRHWTDSNCHPNERDRHPVADFSLNLCFDSEDWGPSPRSSPLSRPDAEKADTMR